MERNFWERRRKLDFFLLSLNQRQAGDAGKDGEDADFLGVVKLEYESQNS